MIGRARDVATMVWIGVGLLLLAAVGVLALFGLTTLLFGTGGVPDAHAGPRPALRVGEGEVTWKRS